MASRLELQSKLEELNGNRNVYYQPPASVKIEYDAIIYSKKDITYTHANDGKYSKTNCYEIIVVSRRPDSAVIDKLLDLPYCSYDRPYVADNLYHDVLTLYY